jgi:hypothetical protein
MGGSERERVKRKEGRRRKRNEGEWRKMGKGEGREEKMKGREMNR